MLFAAALDQIASIPKAIPKLRLNALLERLRGGSALEAALLLEPLGPADLARVNPLRLQSTIASNPTLLADLIEAAYRREAELVRLPNVVWTGPRLNAELNYLKTSNAVRNIVDGAKFDISIAGYHVTSEALEAVGLWRALERGVSVSILVDGNDLKASDRNVFLAKGVRLQTVVPAARQYAKFHAKVILADNAKALVGSANFTTLGHSANIEIGVAFEGPAAATLGAVLRSYVAIAESVGWIVSK